MLDRFEKFIFAACFMAVFIPLPAVSEVQFPPSRNAVGPDEYYLLDDFEGWEVQCLRDRDGVDFCEVATVISDLDEGIELGFSVLPFWHPTAPFDADVDVAPRAAIRIEAFSNAKHYNNLSANIKSIDEQGFDGYWCPVKDISACNQGPYVNASYLQRLLGGERASVAIYQPTQDQDGFSLKSEISVSLKGFEDAFARASDFNDEINGFDPKTPLPTKMCTFRYKGQQRRISYTIDDDFESEMTSVREVLRGPRDGGDCPSYVIMAALTPDTTPTQRGLFCLNISEDLGVAGVEYGTRDVYRRCREPKRSFCEHVNASKDAALAITGFSAAAVGTAVGSTSVTGTTVVLHSSGAAIITGSSGYVAGTLGTIGTTVLGLLTAPVTLTSAAVSVIAVGGAVYVCQGE